MFFSCANCWRTTSALPACRRNRSRNHSDRPSSLFDRVGDAQGRQSPCATQYRTVFREHPSSAAIRFVPHPNPFNRNIADTSSGAFITALRWSYRTEGTAASSIIKPSSAPEGGQSFTSSGGQFAVSSDSPTGTT
jgi:hypothetical protein